MSMRNQNDGIVREDAVTQAMLRALQRVVRSSNGNEKIVTKKLKSNGTKLLKGVVETTPTIEEYWMEIRKEF